MIYFLALLPATALTIAGYFVLYLSARSEGALRTFGRYLGFWAFTLAGLVILGSVFAAAHGHRHCPVFRGARHARAHAWFVATGSGYSSECSGCSHPAAARAALAQATVARAGHTNSIATVGCTL